MSGAAEDVGFLWPSSEIMQPNAIPPGPDATSPALPEQVFFNDPVLDRLMAVTMTLAAEVHVLRERIASLESQVHGSDGPDAAAANADAAQFVRHVLEPLLGEQQSRGHP